MVETLFTRLVSYSQNPAKKSLENFTTEVIAYLINTDRVFRRVFIKHIIHDGRCRRGFRNASAQPQQSFGSGIVDLVISSGARKVLVEIKIFAPETKTQIRGRGWLPQVQKYLDYNEGPVAYLTTKDISGPKIEPKHRNSGYFLGQVFFEDLHARLSGAKLTDAGRMFFKFMEENGMKWPEPFSKNELKIAAGAFDFAEKCESTVQKISSEIEPEFRRLFRTRGRFTRGRFSAADSAAYFDVINFSPGPVRRVWIFLHLVDNKLSYGVALKVPQSSLKSINRFLDWKLEGTYLSSVHPVQPNVKSEKFIAHIVADFRKLKLALEKAG